jgi:hydroxyacyl-ACP dehydratase HTD2-like protein with hotdog domain
MGALDESGRPKNRLSLPPPFGPAIRGGNKFQFFRPVRVGDQIVIHRKITDLKEKQGRRGPLAFLVYDLKYTNQNGELLGINTETLIFQVVSDGKENKEENEKVEGKPVLKNHPGQAIPSLPMVVSKVQMMMYAAATWNPYQLHWDSDYSRKHGFSDANIAGPMFGAYLIEMLARWAGSQSSLKRLEYINRAMAFPGDTLICKGRALESSRESAENLYDCQVWVENQKRQILVQGSAQVTRSPGALTYIGMETDPLLASSMRSLRDL